jgi:hypothetical protein
MVRIREKTQKQLTNRIADAGLLRTDLTLGTVRMFICINNVLQIKESAP